MIVTWGEMHFKILDITWNVPGLKTDIVIFCVTMTTSSLGPKYLRCLIVVPILGIVTCLFVAVIDWYPCHCLSNTRDRQTLSPSITSKSALQVFRFLGFQVFRFSSFQVPSACLTFRHFLTPNRNHCYA